MPHAETAVDRDDRPGDVAGALAGYLGDPISFSLTGSTSQGLGASSAFLFGGGLIMVAVVITWVSPAIRTLALPGPTTRA